MFKNKLLLIVAMAFFMGAPIVVVASSTAALLEAKNKASEEVKKLQNNWLVANKVSQAAHEALIGSKSAKNKNTPRFKKTYDEMQAMMRELKIDEKAAHLKLATAIKNYNQAVKAAPVKGKGYKAGSEGKGMQGKR